MRNKFPQGLSERLTPTSEEVTPEQSNSEEDSVNEPRNEVSRSQKRLLPDRSYAAHNRANEKLVNFIVKQRMVKERLLVGFTSITAFIQLNFNHFHSAGRFYLISLIIVVEVIIVLVRCWE